MSEIAAWACFTAIGLFIGAGIIMLEWRRRYRAQLGIAARLQRGADLADETVKAQLAEFEGRGSMVWHTHPLTEQQQRLIASIADEVNAKLAPKEPS